MNSNNRQMFQFDSFRFDPVEGTLLENEIRIHLQPRVASALALLLERNGRVVGKDEMMSFVWGDVNVGENSLNLTIYQLRKALRDSPANPKYIQTIPKRGFLFLAEVITISAPENMALKSDDPPANGNIDKADLEVLLRKKQWHSEEKLIKGLDEVSLKRRVIRYLLRHKTGVLLSSLFLSLIAVGFLAYFLSHKNTNQPSLPTLRIQGPNRIGFTFLSSLINEHLRRSGSEEILTDQDGPKRSIKSFSSASSSPTEIEIESNKIGVALKNLLERRCDIVLSTRRIRESEVEGFGDLKSRGNSLREYVIGLYGFVVIVNPSNKIASLTKEQMMKVFAGEITKWNDISDTKSGKIKVYVPGDDILTDESDILHAFQSNVLEGRRVSADATTSTNNNSLSDSVSSDPNAIGFVDMASIRSARPVPVSDLGNPPLLPSSTTLNTEDYILSNRFYIYTIQENLSSFGQKLIEFITSQEGQAAVDKYPGVFGQNIIPFVPSIPQLAPEEYKKLISKAERLSVSFRFNAGSVDIDVKGLNDIDRILNSTLISKRIMLFGFASNTGDSIKDQYESHELANAVARQLKQKGINPTVVIGYGSQLMLISESSSNAGQINRRVEIWVSE